MTLDGFKDYHPWTVRLLDGRVFSRRTTPRLELVVVRPWIDRIETFTIHMDDFDVTARLTDGKFNLGEGWVHHPAHAGADRYPLLYRRRCQAELMGGAVHTKLHAYHLGYHPNHYVIVLPNGLWRWNAV